MSERTRRRNRLFLLGLLPGALLLAVSFQLWRLGSANDDALSAYSSGEYADARAGFLGLRDLGVVEPWIRDFNAGTAAYQEKAYADAVDHLEAALETVPSDRQCLVRVNLALSLEAQGLAAQAEKSEAKALIAFRDGRHTLAEGGCGDVDGKGVDGRLAEQISSINAKGPGKSSKENAQLTEEEKLAKLEKLNEEARRRSDDDPVDPTEEPDVAIQW